VKILFCVYELGYADNIGIGFLSAIAKNRGHETFFIAINQKNLIEEINTIQPDIIGYSANIIGYYDIVNKNREARKLHNYISIMGGPYPTFYPETFEESGMDAYCIGEGEIPFDKFLERVENNISFDDVENLITKNGRNPLGRLESNLDDLPIPDRDLIIGNSYLKDVSKKTFFTSRGCPFSCSYCFNNYFNLLYKGQKIVRRFSVDRVIQEIKYLRSKYRLDFIKFGDDLFAIKPDAWLKEFSKKYKEEIGIPFNCYLRLDYINDEILTLLKNAGCFSIHLSVDSTSNYIREKVLNRKVNKKKDLIKEILNIKENYGINTFVNYMLAVPSSLLEDDLETITWSKSSKITFPHYTTAYPIKNTDLYNYCEETNSLPKDFNTTENKIGKFYEKSELTCFSKKEIDTRYNILLLGGLVSKLPEPLFTIGIWIIKNIKPNKLFKKVWKTFSDYQIKKIYIIKK